jgi:pyruvate kinase
VIPVPALSRPISARRLVATLGPASFGREAALRDAGATAFRLNASHMQPAEVAQRAGAALRAAPELACVVDLQGAKMRLGDFEPLEVREGDVLTFVSSAAAKGLSLPHPELFAAVALGEELTIDDGKLTVTVETLSPRSMSVRARGAGWLRPRKGVNRPRHPIDPSGLCASDEAVLDACDDLAGIEYAISFVRDGREAAWVRPRRAILKIERQEAIRTLAATSAMGDEIWICRGDLGAQLGLAPMAKAVHDVDPRRLAVPVLLAGQVLEHLTYHSEPTRSEVCHLYDVLARGFDGIVLSDETAIGVDPENAVRWASRLMGEIARAAVQ